MKKLFFVAIAAVGLCFASCDSKKVEATDAQQDSVQAVVEDPAADLQKALEANDSSAFQKIVAGVQEKFESLKSLDGDALNKAKEYIAKAQAFLNENAEKITAFVGGNSVITGLLDKVKAIPADAIALPETAATAVEGAKDAAEGAAADAVEGAKDAAASAAGAAAEKVEGAVDAAKDAGAKVVDQAKEAGAQAAQKVGEAVDAAADKAKKALGL